MCALVSAFPLKLSRPFLDCGGARYRGVALDDSALGGALYRRVYPPWTPFELAVGRSWRADETYIKVKGGWVFLYRAVDERGRTVASNLSRTRDQTAARTFFRQALRHHGEPRSITLDGFEPSHNALRLMSMRNEFNFRWAKPCQDSQLYILEQHCGTRSPPREVPRVSHVGFQILPQRKSCTCGH